MARLIKKLKILLFMICLLTSINNISITIHNTIIPVTSHLKTAETVIIPQDSDRGPNGTNG